MFSFMRRKKVISVLLNEFGLNRFEILDPLLDIFMAGDGNEYDVAIYYIIGRARAVGYYDPLREEHLCAELRKAQVLVECAKGNRSELSSLIEKAESVRANQASEPFKNFATWLALYKIACAEENPMLHVDEEGKSLIDFMDNDGLKRAFNDRIGPAGLAREFASTFHPDTFGR